MGKLRINEIEVITNEIITRADKIIKEKRNTFMENYKLTKDEKSFCELNNLIEELIKKRTDLCNKIQRNKSLTVNFWDKRGLLEALSNKTINPISRNAIRNNLILKNIDPLFNVETFINDTVNNLTAE